jgi:hypothetical protein
MTVAGHHLRQLSCSGLSVTHFFIRPAHHAVVGRDGGCGRVMNAGAYAWCIGVCTWVQQVVVMVQVVVFHVSTKC